MAKQKAGWLFISAVSFLIMKVEYGAVFYTLNLTDWYCIINWLFFISFVNWQVAETKVKARTAYLVLSSRHYFLVIVRAIKRYCSFHFISSCLCLYLAQANVGHLKLVLIDGSPQAAIKQLHSPTQSSLSRHTYSKEIHKTPFTFFTYLCFRFLIILWQPQRN